MKTNLKKLKNRIWTGVVLSAVFVLPMFTASVAHADYCREFQKTIRIGGHYESGYGTACRQPDGTWMIVDSAGSVDPFDQLRRSNVVIVSQSDPVYYDYGPDYQPVEYFAPAPVRYYRPYPYYPYPYYTTGLSFNFFDRHEHDRHHWGWDRHH